MLNEDAYYRVGDSEFVRPCILLERRDDGSVAIRPNGWTRGQSIISKDQVFMPDQVQVKNPSHPKKAKLFILLPGQDALDIA